MNIISGFDLSILVFFFILIFFAGFYFSRSKSTVEEYLVSPRSIGWVVLGLAAFAVNTSSSTLMIISASARSVGMVVFNYELTGIISCLIFACVFGPVYYKNKISTIPEYLEKRFDSQTRFLFSILTIFTHIFTKISIYLFAGGLFLQQITDLDIYSLMLIITISTGIYSIMDGQRPIIYTQMIQALFILTGGGILFYFLSTSGAGYYSTVEKIPPEFLQLLKSAGDPDYPWPGLILSLLIVGIWYHCLDAEMAQKFLSGKTLNDSQASTIFLGFLKFSILFIVIAPGVLGAVLFPEVSGDLIYSETFQRLVPEGVRIFIIVGFLAALMSSLSASFNACSALYTFDIYKKIYPRAPGFILINIGKIATIVIVVLSMNWIVFINILHQNTFQFVASAFSYMTPPIVAVFCAGIFTKSATSKAATLTLIFGGIISFIMIIFQIMVKTGFTENDILSRIAEFNFFNFTVFSFLFYLLFIFAISLIGENNKKENNTSLEDTTITPRDIMNSLHSLSLRVSASILALIVILIYMYFVWRFN